MKSKYSDPSVKPELQAHEYNFQTKMLFGKHMGKTIQVIVDTNPKYIVWMASAGMPVTAKVLNTAKKIIRGHKSNRPKRDRLLRQFLTPTLDSVEFEFHPGNIQAPICPVPAPEDDLIAVNRDKIYEWL